jgi:hypothetical protein
MDDDDRVPSASSPHQTLVTRLSALGTFVAGGFFLALLLSLGGFGSFDSNALLPAYAKHHPMTSVLAVGGLLAMCAVAWFLARRPHTRLVLSVALPIAGYLLFGFLLALVIARPSWCPVAICPAPGIVTTAGGANDGTMEVYYTALQGAAWEIPGDPAHYSLSSLPQSIGAVRLSGGARAVPYRVVIGAHSLLRSGYSIFVERVEVLIIQVPVTPRPLNVFVNASAVTYQSNLYSVEYRGETAGAALSATYQTVPYGHPLLAPGEADDLDIQMTSSVPADIRFRVRVTYRVADQSAEHTLTVPNVFEVVFADSSNWHPYQLANGHLVHST